MIDIEKMFKEAAAAGEDTGEGNVGGKETIKKEIQSTPTPAKQNTPAPQNAPASKPEPVVQAPTPVSKPEPVVQTPTPVAVPPKRIAAIQTEGLTENLISKILLMNMKLESFDVKQQGFVSGYFGIEDKSPETVIFKALTASQSDLNALKNLVTSRSLDPAERAFFLIGLSNMELDDIQEQLKLITGEFEPIRTNDSNKLDVCRKTEKLISSLQKDIFVYIEKLQDFTNLAFESK